MYKRRTNSHLDAHPKAARTRRWRLGIATSLIAASVLFAASYLVSPPVSDALSSGIVISQIYPNGGTSGAAFRNDFIELYNRGNTPINVAGWSVQYAVGNGAQSSTWAVTPICATSCIIAPQTYFLVQQASSGANGALLPTPDATGTIDLSPNNGKVALVNTTTALTGGTGCPAPASVVDFLGYGAAANCSEGNAPAANPGNNDQSVCRKANGAIETDNNANDFTLCTPNPRNSATPPSLATLNLFSATGYDNGRVLIEWQTGYEIDNLGFNIYRESGGKRTKVNAQLIAGSALMVGSVALTAGRSYHVWDDVRYTKDTVYRIEDVSLSGQSTLHQPITVGRGGARGPQPPGHRRPVLLDSLGQSQDSTKAVQTRVGIPNPTTEELEPQSSIASQPALKLAVRNEDWYRVTQKELIAAGFDPGTNPAHLQLFGDGHERPINVLTESDGTFGPSSAIEFYALGIDAPSTDKHVYWLVAGSTPGARIQHVKGKGSRAGKSSFPFSVERKDRTVYFAGLRNGEKENFFGAVVASSPVDQSLQIQHLDTTSSEQAELEVALQGVTLMAHRVRVSLNDKTVGEVVFDNQERGVARLSVPQTLLKEGQNRIRLASIAGNQDISLVDCIKLTYWHAYVADGDSLRFTAEGKQRITIDGFSSAQIRVVDVTDPNDVWEIKTSVERNSSYSATFSVPGKKQRTLFAFAANRIGNRLELIAERPSYLRDSRNGADFIIITRNEFLAALEPLKLLRERQGMKVALVDADDIYDEFSFGQKTPQAVNDFLAFATNEWDIAPRYVLLAGDASFDPKNYLDNGDFDLVPTKLVDTRYMETASDDWFADFDGDGSSDIPVGRLPVRTASEATAMIDKITGYESSARPDGVLLVADKHEGFDFAAANAGLRLVIPAGVSVDQVDLNSIDGELARAQVLDSLNRGPRIVNYIGHGSVDLWNGGLFGSTDAGSLTNKESLSVFVSMTCLNGYFHDPILESLAESLLKNEQGGAVSVWASSGMTTPDNQVVMDQRMLRLLLGAGGTPTIGDATVAAKMATADMDVRRTWILFGDPTMKLK